MGRGGRVVQAIARPMTKAIGGRHDDREIAASEVEHFVIRVRVRAVAVVWRVGPPAGRKAGLGEESFERPARRRLVLRPRGESGLWHLLGSLAGLPLLW